MRFRKYTIGLLAMLMVAALIAAACGPSSTAPPTEEPTRSAPADDEHMHEHSPGEHMEGAHDVPEEASAVENPVRASEDSVSTGAQLYADNCAVCHGKNGEGDGPAAAALDPPPADLHEDHVQGLSDGALFYIITHGRPETAMPAWGDVLDETERWHVVNFLRTFTE